MFVLKNCFAVHNCSFFLYLPIGSSGLLVCRLDNPALAAEKESRLLLYQDAELDNLSCSERLTKAQLSSMS